jgi:LmbE family N-acetylglucosaminyl deacetylase
VNRVLVVVAHPDDEVLGCGGTAARLAEDGAAVTACILSGAADARANRPAEPRLRENTLSAQAKLGLKEPIVGDFPNIRFNTVPHLELVQFIERAILDTGAELIFTHHPADLNDDHGYISRACETAARIYQRRPLPFKLRGLFLMETLSSTDWRFNPTPGPFIPNAFFEIGESGLKKKIQALAEYEGVMRPFPHPRSEEVIRSLAALRGGQAGMSYAEAFQVAYHDMSSPVRG